MKLLPLIICAIYVQQEIKETTGWKQTILLNRHSLWSIHLGTENHSKSEHFVPTFELKCSVPGIWQTNIAFSGPSQNRVFHRNPDDGFVVTHFLRSLSFPELDETFNVGGLGVVSSMKLDERSENEAFEPSLQNFSKHKPNISTKIIEKGLGHFSWKMNPLKRSIWIFFNLDFGKKDGETNYLRPLKVFKRGVLMKPDPNLVRNV